MQQETEFNSSQDEAQTRRTEARSPMRSPAQEALEYDTSPARAQFNTQRAIKIKASLKKPHTEVPEKQNTPETIRRDKRAPAHIRMSSNP